MLVQRHWTFDQTVAATTWDVDNVPDGAIGAAITHVITDGGQILQPDNQSVAPYGLQLSFGVTAVAGTAYGSYYIDVTDQTTTIDGTNGIVNVTVNQYNGATDSQP